MLSGHIDGSRALQSTPIYLHHQESVTQILVHYVFVCFFPPYGISLTRWIVDISVDIAFLLWMQQFHSLSPWPVISSSNELNSFQDPHDVLQISYTVPCRIDCTINRHHIFLIIFTMMTWLLLEQRRGDGECRRGGWRGGSWRLSRPLWDGRRTQVG